MPTPLDILYRDDWLVAIDKPAGLLVHRSDIDRHETRFAVQLLRDQIGRRVHPVHRLDRPTSGLLLFALDPEAARHLGRQFEAGEMRKTYLAVVRGWPAEAGLIDRALALPEDDYSGEAGLAPQPAQTEFRRLATAELPYPVDRYPAARYALLALRPLTGRRHQLRRHLKHIAHPIIGDVRYGKGSHNRFFQTQFGCRRLLLACTGLVFRHPDTEAAMTLEAPLAADFAATADRLGWTQPASTVSPVMAKEPPPK